MFNQVWGVDDTEDDLEGEGQDEEEGTERSPKGTDKSAKVFAVMKMVKAFSDFTNTSFDVVWNKSLGEVLSVLGFARQYNEEQRQLMNKWKRRH